jgi:hypothetical protein
LTRYVLNSISHFTNPMVKAPLGRLQEATLEHFSFSTCGAACASAPAALFLGNHFWDFPTIFG